MICASAPVSREWISTNEGSNANKYGYATAKKTRSAKPEQRMGVGGRGTASLRETFPGDHPIVFCAPSVFIHEEGEFIVTEQEESVKSVYCDGFGCSCTLLARNKVEGRISRIK
jgi:hypothetical protein